MKRPPFPEVEPDVILRPSGYGLVIASVTIGGRLLEGSGMTPQQAIYRAQLQASRPEQKGQQP